MLVINRAERTEVEAEDGAIYIRQDGPDEADVIQLWPEHIDSICAALLSAKEEALKQERHGDA